MGGSRRGGRCRFRRAPWWQTTLRALDVVFCALAVAAVVMYVLHNTHGRFLRGKAEESCRQKELMEVEPDE